jgi:hypothetical protein
MSIFDFYIDRAEEYSVPGKANELMVTTRKGRGNTVAAINNDKSALMLDTTMFSNGDLCTEVNSGDTYFIVAKQSSSNAIRCQLRKTNATIDIVRITQHYTGSKNDYDYETPLHTNVTAFYEDVSGKMQQFDASLVSKATRRFLVPKLDIKLMDRIKINGTNAQIEVINASSYPGLLSVQTSNDIRVTKVIP